MTVADAVIAHIEGNLKIPTGPLAGKPFTLLKFQRDWIHGTFEPDIDVGVLCIGRGNGKTTLAAGIAHAGLVGVMDNQPRREIVIVARTLEQGRVCYDYLVALIQGLPQQEQKSYTIRKAPRLEVTYRDSEGIEHAVRVVASDGRSALGGSPTLVICDERGHWDREKGDLAENVHMTGAAKRGGKVLMISTSASDDLHTFSRWIDDPPAGTYVQEHRANPDLTADDEAGIIAANPGCTEGVGATLEIIKRQAARAIQRGGSALTQFKWLVLNQRVADENRCVVLTTDEWMACEAVELPARQGLVVIGVDAGESVSMSAAAYYWPETGRLEVHAHFPSEPDLLSRGQNDKVGDRYHRMAERGELSLIGQKTVPIADWIRQVFAYVQGEPVHAIVCDKFKESQLLEGVEQAGFRGQIIWRRFGFFDGNEDLDRFRTAALDKEIKTLPSLLMRSAIADCVVQRDDNGNNRLAKGRSLGRIDAVAAAVIAVAEGKRLSARPVAKAPRVQWA
jgi:phage terminase large subunit-like protein